MKNSKRLKEREIERVMRRKKKKEIIQFVSSTFLKFLGIFYFFFGL
jgi:hypothetical protein